jgi:hypothetical protein
MVTKKDLQDFGLSLEEFFEYVIESKNIGADQQAWFLFGLMSDDQQKRFFEYVDATYFYEVDNDEFVSEMISFRNYFNIDTNKL